MTDQPVPLSELDRDLPVPGGGWAAELDRRGVELVADDLGRPAVDRATARALFAEHRENEARGVRLRLEAEQRAVEAYQRFRTTVPSGVPAGMVPEGVSAGQLLMLSDPMNEGPRRESVLEHALANPDGALIYHPIHGGEE